MRQLSWLKHLALPVPAWLPLPQGRPGARQLSQRSAHFTPGQLGGQDAASALEQEVLYRRALFEASIDGIVILDGQGNVLEANNSFAAMLGYSPAEITRLNVADFDPNLGQIEAEQKEPKIGLDRFERLHRRRDGSTYAVEISASAVTWNGQVVYLCVCREIGERARLDAERNQTETILRQSEARYLSILEEQTEFIARFQPDGTFIFANDAYCRYFGLSKEELEGTSYQPAVYPADRPLIERQLATLSPEHPIFTVENRVCVRGEVRWTKWTNKAIYDDDQTIVELQSVGHDIHDRKQAELKISRLQTALLEAQQVAHIGNWEFDLASQTITWSPELFRMFGLDPAQGEPTYASYLKMIHSDDRYLLKQAVEQAVTERKHYRVDYRAVLPNGQVRYHEGRGEVECDRAGQVTRLFGTALDITDRKQAEAALQASEARFRAIVEQAAVGINQANALGQFIQANQYFCDLLGYSRAKLLTLSFQAITHPEDFERDQAQIRRLFQGQQESFTTTKRYRHQSGDWIWTEVTLSAIRNGAGEVISDLAIVVDIRDRKRAEQQLTERNQQLAVANQDLSRATRLKDQFLANMSHELRTPLNVILGFAQVLSADLSLQAQQQEYVRNMHRSGDHLLHLINDILDLSKIEANRITLEPESTDLLDLLADLQGMFQERAEDKDLHFTLALAPDLPQYIVVDPNKLRQVLINLLGNAIKFTQEGSIALRVGLQPTPLEPSGAASALAVDASPGPPSEPACLVFAVEDTGPGIADAELSAIFEAFTQAKAGKVSLEGTGLGLTISRSLVQLMGGELSVSSSLGQGSTFCFTLPLHLAKAEDVALWGHPGPVIGLAPGQPTYRVLVVDDQPENRQLLVTVLSQIGLAVQEAASGTDAIARWQQWHPHLIAMDLRMPDIDGCEATRQIRAAAQHLADSSDPVIIALTAQASSDERSRALAAGCDDFISKPIQLDLLWTKLSDHLGLCYLYADSPHPASAPVSLR